MAVIVSSNTFINYCFTGLLNTFLVITDMFILSSYSQINCTVNCTEIPVLIKLSALYGSTVLRQHLIKMNVIRIML